MINPGGVTSREGTAREKVEQGAGVRGGVVNRERKQETQE